MHELSLCQSAVELVLEQVSNQNVKRVTAVWFEAGATATIEEDALRFAFDCASLGTLLAGAKVHYNLLPAQAWCWDCEQTVEVSTYGAPCPICQGHRLNLGNDSDLRVKQVEVE